MTEDVATETRYAIRCSDHNTDSYLIALEESDQGGRDGTWETQEEAQLAADLTSQRHRMLGLPCVFEVYAVQLPA